MNLSATEQLIARHFLTAPRFAVVGASKDQGKFGTRVLKWYQARDMDVKPVHIREDELEGLKTIRSLSELEHPTETAVSIITPAKVTLELLKTAASFDFRSFWLQPGADDVDVRAYVEESGLGGKVLFGGPCILRDGDFIRMKEKLEDEEESTTSSGRL